MPRCREARRQARRERGRARFGEVQDVPPPVGVRTERSGMPCPAPRVQTESRLCRSTSSASRRTAALQLPCQSVPEERRSPEPASTGPKVIDTAKEAGDSWKDSLSLLLPPKLHFQLSPTSRTGVCTIGNDRKARGKETFRHEIPRRHSPNSPPRARLEVIHVPRKSPPFVADVSSISWGRHWIPAKFPTRTTPKAQASKHPRLAGKPCWPKSSMEQGAADKMAGCRCDVQLAYLPWKCRRCRWRA